MEKNLPRNLSNLPAFDKESEYINVIVEVPKGRRNKYKYLEDEGLFELSATLPAGHVFPFDFGFIPSTLGEDGDPIDILILMEEPAFPGCLVRSRLIGVIEAEQTERDGTTEKNDRLLAVYHKSVQFANIKTIKDLDKKLLEEITHFFESYNEMKGKKFKSTGVHGSDKAERLVKEAIKRARKEKE